MEGGLRSFFNRIFGKAQDAASHAVQPHVDLDDLLGLKQEVVATMKSLECRKQLLDGMRTARLEFEAESRILNREENELLMCLLWTYRQRLRDSEREFADEERNYHPGTGPPRKVPQHSLMSGRNGDDIMTEGADDSDGRAEPDSSSSSLVDDSLKERVTELEKRLEAAERDRALLREHFEDESLEVLQQVRRNLEGSLSQYSFQLRQLEDNLSAERQTIENITREVLMASEERHHMRDFEKNQIMTNSGEKTKIGTENSTEGVFRDHNGAGHRRKLGVDDLIAEHQALLVEQARATEAAKMRLEKLRVAAANLGLELASSPTVHASNSIPQGPLHIPAFLPYESSLYFIVPRQTESDQNRALSINSSHAFSKNIPKN